MATEKSGAGFIRRIPGRRVIAAIDRSWRKSHRSARKQIMFQQPSHSNCLEEKRLSFCFLFLRFVCLFVNFFFYCISLLIRICFTFSLSFFLLWFLHLFLSFCVFVYCLSFCVCFSSSVLLSRYFSSPFSLSIYLFPRLCFFAFESNLA